MLLTTMSKKMISVLTTVNAPYSLQLNEAELAYCLSDLDVAKKFSGQISSLLGEVSVSSQVEFASAHGISIDKLKAFAVTFSEWSGESYQLAA